MKQILIIALLLASILTNAQTVVNVSDFGAGPNPFTDATASVKSAIAACKSTPGAQLVFPTGRYDFWPEHTEKREYFISNTSTEQECPSKWKNIGMLFEEMENLIVEGNGSQFVFHGKMITWTLDRCRNITLQNFSVDFERPSMSEMTLLEVTPNHIIAQIHPDSKYAIINGKLLWYGEGWGITRYHVILEDTVASTGIYSSWNPVLNGTTTELAPGKIWVDGDFSNTNYKTGHILTLRDPYRDHVGAFVNLSSNIRLDNVTMHYMHGLGIVSQFSENLSYRNVNIVPSRGRAIATFADGMHFSGCKGKVLIEGCHFSGLHDDPVNVHGIYLQIREIHSPTELTIRFMHGQSYGFPAFFENDSVAYIHAKSLQTKETTTVKSTRLISEREMRIELSTPLPTGIGIGDCLENITWTPSLEVRNNRFEMTNTRGLLVTTPREVVIEDNTFYRTGMHAILIASDAGSWFESGAVNDVTIRNNLFDGCGYNSGMNSYTIAISPENHEQSENQWVHSNIRIENNRFRVYEGRVLTAKCTNGIIFRNNIIEDGTFAVAGRDATEHGPRFKLDNCTNVEEKEMK